MIINKFLKYTWKNEWIHPYESIYSIIEKFKAANVFTSSEMSKILNMPPSVYTAKTHFNKEFNVFRNVAFSLSYTNNISEDNILDIFTNVEKFLDIKIKYCPTCIKQGYHSVLHQLTFLDKCPIHNDDLVYLCECRSSYLITYKSKLPAYHCKCGKSLPVPKIEECIMNLWRKKFQFPNILHSNIKYIKIIDYFNYPNRDLGMDGIKLNEKLKKVLVDLFFKGFSDINPVLKLQNDTHASTESFFAYIIHNFIIKKYGTNECLKTYWLLQGYGSMKITDDIRKNYDIDLIAYFYLLEELLGKNRIDLIYPNSIEYGILDEKDLSSYHNFIKYELNDVCYEVRNYVYKRLIMERHFQIKKYMLEKNILPDTQFVIELKDSFPIFVIMLDQAGSIYLYD